MKHLRPMLLAIVFLSFCIAGNASAASDSDSSDCTLTISNYCFVIDFVKTGMYIGVLVLLVIIFFGVRNMNSNDGLGSSGLGGGVDSDSYTLGFGAIIAICAVALLFGGQTFTWWSASYTIESTTPSNGMDFAGEVSLEFGMDEGVSDFEFSMWDSEDSSKEDLTDGELNDKNNVTKWTDDDCDTDSDGEPQGECKETAGFFTIIKYMVYGLLVCGLALIYIGQTGQMTHMLSALAIFGVLISAGIMAYTFVALPEASLEDDDVEDTFFAEFDSDPVFILNVGKEEYDDDWETDVKSHLRIMPGIAFFVPVVPLTLFGYLIYYSYTKAPLLERKSYVGVDQWSKASDDRSESIEELDLDNLLGKETSGSDDKGDMPSVTASPVKVDEKTSEEEVQSFKAKKDDSGKMEKIKCPECEALMMVPKLNKAQQVKCDACGLEGEITI